MREKQTCCRGSSFQPVMLHVRLVRKLRAESVNCRIVYACCGAANKPNTNAQPSRCRAMRCKTHTGHHPGWGGGRLLSACFKPYSHTHSHTIAPTPATPTPRPLRLDRRVYAKTLFSSGGGRFGCLHVKSCSRQVRGGDRRRVGERRGAG